MTALLKSFLHGLLYIVVLPALLVILAVYSVAGVVMFIFIGIKSIFLFFTGRSLGELPEDLKAREILEGVPSYNEVPQEKPVEVEAINKQDLASTYYVPLNQDIPAPTPIEENKDINSNNGEGGNNQ